MKHVYLLESISRPEQKYKGLADDVVQRLERHNAGQVPSTARYRPWRLVLPIQNDFPPGRGPRD